MLCLPGFTPVANDAQAVGDSGDTVVSSGYAPPPAISRENAGMCPSFMYCWTRSGSRPSNPRITSFGRPESTGSRLHAATAATHATATIARRRMQAV